MDEIIYNGPPEGYTIDYNDAEDEGDKKVKVPLINNSDKEDDTDKDKKKEEKSSYADDKVKRFNKAEKNLK